MNDMWVRDGLYPRDLVQQAYEQWPGYDSEWTIYNNSDQCKRTNHRWHTFPPAIWELTDLIIRDGISHIVKYSPLRADYGLWGAGICTMGPGDYLNDHLDADVHYHLKWKRLYTSTLIVNTEWNEEWGGIFEMGDNRVVPAFNRTIIFGNTDNAIHRITPIATDAPPRYSISVFWYGGYAHDYKRPKAQFIQ